jgi:hypothetical protein
MKYKFVYDQAFLDNKKFELSLEEVQLIQCILNGGHNVCLRGYKPERIVSAIKTIVGDTQHIEEPSSDITLQDFCGGGPELKQGVVSLAHEGLLIMNHLENFKTAVVEMACVPLETGSITLSRCGNNVRYPAKFQLIATLTDGCKEELVPYYIVTKCEIDYYCNPDVERSLVKTETLVDKVVTGWQYHLSLQNTSEKNHDRQFDCSDFSELAWDMYGDKIVPNWSKPMNIVKVARSIADMRFHTRIKTSDLETAERLFTPQFV